MSSLSRKTVAWAAGAALAVGGGTAGIVIATQGGGQPTTGGTAVARAAAARPAPLDLVSVSPVSLSKTTGTQAVDGAGTIVVTYNQPVPATAPLPTLSPATAGTWQRSGDVAIFTPANGYAAGTRVTVTVTGCPPLWAAITMPAVAPPTASAAPAANATVFRDRLLTVLLSLLCVTSRCHAYPQ